MATIKLLKFSEDSPVLDRMIEQCLKDHPYERITSVTNIEDLSHSVLLIAYKVDPVGTNEALNQFIHKLHLLAKNNPIGETRAALMVVSDNDLYTKSSARNTLFLLNRLGIDFIGAPIIEATGDLKNLSRWKKVSNKSENEVLDYLCDTLSKNLLESKKPTFEKPKILAIHSSDRNTSNTLILWDMVADYLDDVDIQEVSLYSEEVNECKGCLFDVCTGYGKKGACFFNDFITKEVYHKILEADVIVFICPNYNDTLGSKMIALINRLTVLYRTTKLNQKIIFSVIVSGNSGGDCVAEQLIGSLNINKGFYLPGNFTLFETANSPRSILTLPNIQEKAKKFAEKIIAK